MKEYDIIVIGSGSGMAIVNQALSHEVKVALVDKGLRLGGTCLNYGCIPSKTLIHTADRIMETEKNRELGISMRIENIDFPGIMARMRKFRDDGEREVREGIRSLQGLDLFNGEGHFVDEYTLHVDGEQLRGKQIFIACGSRPLIPPIKGLNDVDYLTNESLLELESLPESLVIIGGGYIGVEYAHFFSAMGTKVTVVEMADRLILSEEPEIADLLLQQLRKRMNIVLNSKVVEVNKTKNGVSVVAEDTIEGKQANYNAASLLVALGRRSNADLLKVENTGIELDKKGFIKVNQTMETSKENIWAIGDANGIQMFTHVANREAELAIYNVLHGEKNHINRNVVPHAVYSYPAIASVGMLEQEAAAKHKILVGKTSYFHTAKGQAMLEDEGFAKVILDPEKEEILGFHIIGPSSPVLIQEVVNAMTSGGEENEIFEGIHIHPALSELVPVTLSEVDEEV